MLRDRFRVMALDFRGHGDSACPTEPFTLDDLASDVARAIEAQASEDAIVAGASLGGMVALILAVRAPTKVSALILSDTFARCTPELGDTLEERAIRAETEGMSALVDATIERWFTHEFVLANPTVIDRFRIWLLADDPQVHAWTWRAMKRLDVSRELASIRIPTLVFNGAQDISTTPALARRLVDAIPSAEYVEVPRAGHMALTHQPTFIVRAMLEFLARVL
jgi:pimeloyl-ACP methyl ester carboxylesterase